MSVHILNDGCVSNGICKPSNALNFDTNDFDSLLAGPAEDMAPVHDVILGTSLHGTGRTTGEMGVELVPDGRRGVFESIFSGTAKTETVGYNGPVTIYNDSLTQLISRTRVTVGSQGLSMYATISRARNTSFTKGLETRFPGSSTGSCGNSLSSDCVATDLWPMRSAQATR